MDALVVAVDLLVDGGAVLTGAGFTVGLVAEVLELDEEVIGSEDVAKSEQGGAGLVIATGVDQVADLPVAAAGEADEALIVLT